MIKNKLTKYILIQNLNENNIKNIKKLTNIKIIYNNEVFNDISLTECKKIKHFCKINKIQFYIINNYKIALRVKADGIFLSAHNKKLNFNEFVYNKFHIIGSAHNQIEYYFKNKQKCQIIILSPIFFNPKYSKNKILGPTKFNLMSLRWSTNLCAMGGINNENVKLVNLTKAKSVAFQRLVEEEEDKPAHIKNGQVY
jgi:thiamine-phosphate pyrophosphorylase